MLPTVKICAASLVAAGTVIAGATIPAHAAGSVESTVTVTGFDGSDVDHVKFFGKVKSDKAICEAGRHVVLRQTDDGVRAGADTTNANGRWSIVFDGNKINPGHFKAIVDRKVVKKGGHRIVCAADTVKYDGAVPQG
ncbi:hypothetical protein [Nocardioides panacisoli]